MDIQEYLANAKSYLVEIETITRSLGADPSAEQIVDVVHKRDSIVANLKGSEQEISETHPQWLRAMAADPVLNSLRLEATSVLSRIADFDGKLAKCMELKMDEIRQQLARLYTTSRAATSYTAHSTMTIAQ